jgi:hypothetical protein
MRIKIFIGILSLSFMACAQTREGRWLDREIQIEVDNDAFTLDIYLDQYYSQGSFAKYRVVDTTGRNKKVKWVGINHRIYTPRFVSFENVENFDRPYAGQLSASAGLSFYEKRQYFNIAVEAGVMGQASLAEPIQKGWHQVFGMPIPQGWDYQMNNALMLNAQFDYSILMIRAGNLQILSEAHISGGTDFTFVRPDIMVRLGKFNFLNESVQYGGNLGHEKRKSRTTRETIIFLAFGPEYVFYNSTIEGNIVGRASEHTEELVNWVYQTRVGAMMSWSSFDLAVIYYRRSVETVGALNHRYVGVRLSQRF